MPGDKEIDDNNIRNYPLKHYTIHLVGKRLHTSFYALKERYIIVHACRGRQSTASVCHLRGFFLMVPVAPRSNGNAIDGASYSCIRGRYYRKPWEDEKDPPQSTGQGLLMRSTIYSLRSQVYWLWKPDPKGLLYPQTTSFSTAHNASNCPNYYKSDWTRHCALLYAGTACMAVPHYDQDPGLVFKYLVHYLCLCGCAISLECIYTSWFDFEQITKHRAEFEKKTLLIRCRICRGPTLA